MQGLLHWKKVAILTIIILFSIVPVITKAPYVIHIFNIFFIWAVVAANWDLIFGYAGIWSMGNVAFMVLGGYTYAILTKHLGVPPLLCVPLGGLGSMIVVTIIIGLPSLKLKGIYVALLTIVFASTLPSLAYQTREYSGGSNGLLSLPELFSGITGIHWYYINLVFFLVIMAVIYRIIHSSSGLAFMALRDSWELATALGVSEYREKLKIFAISSFMTGMAGAIFAAYTHSISPTMLTTGPFVTALAMVVVGGVGRFPGALLGAGLLIFVGEWLRLFGTLRNAMVGGLICAVIFFFPGGLMQLAEWVTEMVGQMIHKTTPELLASDVSQTPDFGNEHTAGGKLPPANLQEK